MTQLKKILLVVTMLAVAALGGAALAGATSGDNALTSSTLDRASSAASAATGGGTVTGSEGDSEHGATDEVERDHEDGGDDASDQALTGSALARASKAALAKTGGGKVTGSERDAEHGAVYKVEVTKADGSQIDVRLDGAFNVVAAEPDHDD